jgi:Protein of unknown function (DUF3108)
VSGHRPTLVPLALLTLGVMLAHSLLVGWLAESLSRLGGADAPQLRRIEVAFVTELQPAQPPPPSPAAAPRPTLRARVAAPAAAAASAAAANEPAAAPPPAASAPADLPAPDAPLEQALPAAPDAAPALADRAPDAAPALSDASSAGPMVAAPADAASAAASGTARFEWPPSTRLSYVLVGDYRGPVHGSAQVEWLRSGERYQVHLDVSIGPVLSRRMSSEGLLTAQGLKPRRYEEVTQVLLREPRRLSMQFTDDSVLMANGQVQPTLPQVQDTASQFVQLTWLFTTQSDRLRQGQTIEMPLALPRRVDNWVYDVQAEEELDTPVGRIKAFHMKPRRSQALRGELVVESWFAPSLQYLPVRILIRQDAQTFVDLTLSRAPQQEARPPEAPAVTGR